MSKCGCGTSFQGCGDNCPELLPDGVEGTCGIDAQKVGDRWVLKGTLPTELENGGGVTIEDISDTNDDGCPVKKYRLSVSCCDERVRVCAGEGQPKFLSDAIDVTQPITMDVDCASGKITFGLDTSQIAHPRYIDCNDNVIQDGDAVMTPSVMNSIYNLGDCYAWFDGPTVEAEQIPADELTGCKRKRLKRKCEDRCTCCSKGVAEVVLVTDVHVVQAVGGSSGSGGVGTGFYGVIDDSGGVSINGFAGSSIQPLQSSREEVHSYGPLLASDKGFICNNCPIGRLVEIEAAGTIEGSWGVNGLRVQVYKICTDNTFEPAAEWRDSPTGDADVDGDGIGDNYETTSYKKVSGNTDPTINYGYRYQERQTFNLRRKVRLEPNCCLFLGVKVSSVIDDPDYDSSYPAIVSVLGKLGSDGSVSGDMGAYISAMTIDDCCIIKAKSEDCDCGIVIGDSTEPLEPDAGGNGTFVLPAILPGTGASP